MWGLVDRDVPLTRLQIASALDFIATILRSGGRGLTDNELISALKENGLEIESTLHTSFWFGIASVDRRFRVWPGGILGLREWNSPRRMSTAQAVAAVVGEATRPMSANEIQRLAVIKGGRPIFMNSVLGSLRMMGARYSSSLGGWVRGDGDNEPEEQ
jgi:hypothetical protein